MDATPFDRILYDNPKIERGVGQGFTSFLGLSEKNHMWVASLDANNNIVNEKLIEFNAGDVLILPFGTLHAGDKNRTGSPTCKVVSEVYTNTLPDNTSQLWVVENFGLTKQKQTYQFHNNPSRCVG